MNSRFQKKHNSYHTVYLGRDESDKSLKNYIFDHDSNIVEFVHHSSAASQKLVEIMKDFAQLSFHPDHEHHDRYILTLSPIMSKVRIRQLTD